MTGLRAESRQGSRCRASRSAAAARRSRFRAGSLVGTVLVVVLGCTADPPDRWWEAAGSPPVAPKEPKLLEAYGDTRQDPYYWLRDQNDPRTSDYLEAENAYAEAALAPLAPLIGELVEEMRGRVARETPMAPFPHAGFDYYARFAAGADYPVYYRRPLGGGPEQVLLDVAAICAEYAFCRVEVEDPSPDGRILPYDVDSTGNRRYEVRFLDMESGETLPDVLTGPAGGVIFGLKLFSSVAWAADSRTVFYPSADPETFRFHRIYRHRLGDDAATDAVVYEEPDERFWAVVAPTRSGRHLVVYSLATNTTEASVLPTDDPMGDFRVVLPRRDGHEYWVEDYGDDLLLRTNDSATGFRLVRAPARSPSRANWEEVVAGRDGILLDALEVVAGHAVLIERQAGLAGVRLVHLETGEQRRIELDEPAYRLWLDWRQEPDGADVRLDYTSMTTPRTLMALDLATGSVREVARREELVGYDPAAYATERLVAPVRDGSGVPITVVYRRDLRTDGPQPLLLYGYGSYGVTMDPRFDANRLSLLDRGFLYAVAHIRGGQFLGREWYEDGRAGAKRNTFWDFADAARYLVDAGYTDPGVLFARGESAGGLLMGVTANEAPELFRGIVAKVPFVDVVTSMQDPSIPLVTSEYQEWGDPRTREGYEHLKSYSPYDNVAPKAYPHLFVMAGLHDRQVMYWEPAKWVAKLRATRTDDGLTLLLTDMESGHSGGTRRSGRVEEEARIQAFLLRLAGLG